AARNVELALQARGVPRSARRAQTEELLETVRLSGFGGKRPHELSGGMRQRVAMARALAQDADVLLMDEPFGALDAMTAGLLHDELDRVRAGRNLTVLFVTHNVREAVRLGDRVVLLSSRPGTVIAEYPVPIQRPRRIDSAAVAELAGAITDRLREEVGRHGKGHPGRARRARPRGSDRAGRRGPGCRAELVRAVAEGGGIRPGACRLGADPPHGLEEIRLARPGDRSEQPVGAGEDGAALARDRDHAAAGGPRVRAGTG